MDLDQQIMALRAQFLLFRFEFAHISKCAQCAHLGNERRRWQRGQRLTTRTTERNRSRKNPAYKKSGRFFMRKFAPWMLDGGVIIVIIIVAEPARRSSKRKKNKIRAKRHAIEEFIHASIRAFCLIHMNRSNGTPFAFVLNGESIVVDVVICPIEITFSFFLILRSKVPSLLYSVSSHQFVMLVGIYASFVRTFGVAKVNGLVGSNRTENRWCEIQMMFVLYVRPDAVPIVHPNIKYILWMDWQQLLMCAVLEKWSSKTCTR